MKINEKELIIDFCQKNNIKAYDLQKNTPLSQSTSTNLLNPKKGSTESTIRFALNYLKRYAAQQNLAGLEAINPSDEEIDIFWTIFLNHPEVYKDNEYYKNVEKLIRIDERERFIQDLIEQKTRNQEKKNQLLNASFNLNKVSKS